MPSGDITVLHLNRSPFMGGVERILLTLLPGLQKLGYRAVLGCLDDGDLAKFAHAVGIEVFRLDIDRMRASFNPLRLLHYAIKLRRGSMQIAKVCVAQNVSLVHAHHPVGALYAARACKLLNLPMILHVHETKPASVLYKMALKRASRFVDQYICVSKSAEALVHDVLGSNVHSKVIYNGVDDSFLNNEFLPAFDVTGVGPHIGVFGVIEPRKGQDVFLQAARDIALMLPDARFWIVGSLALRDKQAYLDRLMASAERSGIRGRVQFTGFRSDIAQLMCAMNVVVLPSVAHESFGMVLVEALALGRPTVASAIGGIPEVIDNGRTGYLVPPNDPASLSAAIIEALSLDGVKRGKCARAEIRERFSANVFQTLVAQCYDSLIPALEARGGEV